MKIPVSDTQAYRQFGNSVAVPVVRAIAAVMVPRILTPEKYPPNELSETQTELPLDTLAA